MRSISVSRCSVDMTEDFAGQVAIVTGGVRGIGQVVAKRLTARGATVIVPDLVRPEAGAAGEYIAADLTNPSAIQDLFDQTIDDYGRLDVLVNNAGLRRVGPTVSLSLDDWSAVIAVNLTAAFLCSAAFARHVLERRGQGAIVNVASTAALLGLPGRAPYCASKAGLLGLTRALTVEWADQRIPVNAVAPGNTLTHMAKWASDNKSVDEETMLRRIPMNRFADPDEIASAICFLASSDATYVTGEVLYVDGGWAAMSAEKTGGSDECHPDDTCVLWRPRIAIRGSDGRGRGVSQRASATATISGGSM